MHAVPIPSVVVFDLVGAVLGGSEAMGRAWAAAFRAAGLQIDEESADDILGMCDAAGALAVFASHRSARTAAPEEVAHVCAAFRKECIRLFRHGSGRHLTPGWERTVRALLEQDIPVAAMTYLDRGTALELCGLHGLSVPLVSISDAVDGPLGAGPLYAACQTLEVDPAAAWLVADSPALLAQYPEVRAIGLDTGWANPLGFTRLAQVVAVVEDVDEVLDVLSLRRRRVEME